MEENNTKIQEIPEPKEKNRKKTILKTILLILFFCATFYCIYLFTKELSGSSVATFRNVFKQINVSNLLLLILLVIVLFFTDALKYSIIAKIIKGKFDYGLCINIGIMGRFYDNITPFNTGGQAYQVYQLYKKGYTPSEATAIPIVKYIFQLLSWIFVCIILYIINHKVLMFLPSGRASGIKIASYVGIFIASLAPTIVILFSLFPKTVEKIIVFFMKLLNKMKILKDYKKHIEKVNTFLGQYKEAFVKINRNILGIVLLFILSMIDFVLIMSIPYFVLITIGNASGSFKLFFDVITLNAYSLFAASLVPTPGNSGAIEAVYSMVFAPIPMGEGFLFWIVFTWRFCSYYIYLLIGFVETIYLLIKHRIKEKREKLIEKGQEKIMENDSKKTIRILEVVDNYFPAIDGVVNVVDNYARLLNKKENIEVEVLVPWFPKSPKNQDYKVIRSLSIIGGTYGVRLALPIFDVKMKRYLNNRNYDLIHCHSPATLGKYIAKYAKKHNIPIIFTIHTRYHEEINRAVKSKFLQNFALNFLLKTIKQMDYLWAVSQGNKTCLNERYKIDMPCKVMRNGTDIKPIDIEKTNIEIKKIRSDLNIKEDEKVLLFVGRLVLVKNIGMLLDTMKILKDKNKKYRLIIVGDGDYKDKLVKKCDKLNLNDCVDFVGNVTNRHILSAYYNLSYLLVFPSTFDSCPLVIKEAAAMNLPLLVVKNSSSAEEVIDNHNSFVAEKSPEVWAEKINKISENLLIYNEVKKHCRKELYKSWETIIEDVLDNYMEILDKNKN